MLKQILTFCLSIVILTVASGANVFAQTGSLNADAALAKPQRKADAADLKSVIKAQSRSGELNISDKSTLADYERSKRQGKGMSTTTKVLIGVGIAVAVIAIVAVVAKKDLKNDILR